MTGQVRVVPVATDADLARFIELPYRLHAGDPNWVPPLRMERREALSPKHNPLFQHAEVQFFLGFRGDTVVGRISAQVDRLSLELRDDATGFFGMVAGEDDREVFAALTAAAEGWLRDRGMAHVLGPFNLSINEETGLLIRGWDRPPVLMMGHDRPYIAGHLEALGYAKAKDVLAYWYDISRDVPAAVRARIDRPTSQRLTVRPLDMKRYDQEIAAVTDIFNNAWMGNWGFVPLTEAETAHMAKSMRPLIHPKLVSIVEVDGEPAAMGVCLPNLNEAIRDLGGNLLPLGWAKLLWRLKVAGVKTSRVPLMGVKRKFAKGFTGMLLPFLVLDGMRKEALKQGIRYVELSWILEDNKPMRSIIESLDAVADKTYRIYGKAL